MCDIIINVRDGLFQSQNSGRGKDCYMKYDANWGVQRLEASILFCHCLQAQ